ncbi:MAG: NUMOD4 motif-containing HNH endonuclease [Bacteroidales bacterium]|nr:NUMOD4 motif-containing HNH endonuclease [Bacteroidales bacterium]
MKTEIWKDVLGYEGLYKVSNLGRVKRIWREKERILKLRDNGTGYYRVELCENGKRKGLSVHRLVVEAFLYKIPNGSVVNHINEIKTDNRLENLEICTIKENNSHGTRTTRAATSRRGKFHSEEAKRKMSEAQKVNWQRRRKED